MTWHIFICSTSITYSGAVPWVLSVWVLTHRKVLLHVSAAWSWRQHHDSRLVCGGFHNFIRFNCSFLCVMSQTSCLDCYMSWRMPVRGLPKVWTVFVRSNTGVMGSNPTRDMHVCMRLFCVCVVLCVGSGLATGWSSVQGVLPTVYRIKKLKKRLRSTKGSRAVDT
jgi:hypothetical protein